MKVARHAAAAETGNGGRDRRGCQIRGCLGRAGGAAKLDAVASVNRTLVGRFAPLPHLPSNRVEQCRHRWRQAADCRTGWRLERAASSWQPAAADGVAAAHRVVRRHTFGREEDPAGILRHLHPPCISWRRRISANDRRNRPAVGDAERLRCCATKVRQSHKENRLVPQERAPNASVSVTAEAPLAKRPDGLLRSLREFIVSWRRRFRFTVTSRSAGDSCGCGEWRSQSP